MGVGAPSSHWPASHQLVQQQPGLGPQKWMYSARFSRPGSLICSYIPLAYSRAGCVQQGLGDLPRNGPRRSGGCAWGWTGMTWANVTGRGMMVEGGGIWRRCGSGYKMRSRCPLPDPSFPLLFILRLRKRQEHNLKIHQFYTNLSSFRTFFRHQNGPLVSIRR